MSYFTSWEELRQDGQLPKFSTIEEQCQTIWFSGSDRERQARCQASMKVKFQKAWLEQINLVSEPGGQNSRLAAAGNQLNMIVSFHNMRFRKVELPAPEKNSFRHSKAGRMLDREDMSR